MSNTEIVRAMFDAYRAGDKGAGGNLLADDLLFTSPQDDGIDKRAYLERCFPTADHFVSQEIVVLIDADDDDVVLVYEYELKSGDRHRNAELITVRDGRIAEIQVYFGGRVRS